jgi:uncharacterized protein YbjT (DUF2867 family)
MSATKHALWLRMQLRQLGTQTSLQTEIRYVLHCIIYNIRILPDLTILQDSDPTLKTNLNTMAARDHNVIVFGPTGAVGCAAAIEAHRLGAKVWLAMRDVNKPIKGLKDQGTEGYERIHADLTKPDTLKSAVQKSGAKSAYVYCIFPTDDGMKSSFEALKEAGITYVVLLSSFGIKGDPADKKNEEHFIGKQHAHVEISLRDSGIPYAAVRSAYFNSNTLWNKEGMKKGEVELLYPQASFDYIAPPDIGTVCGGLLVEPDFRDKNEKGETVSKTLILCGPKVMTQREAYGVIGKALGHEIKIIEIDEEKWYTNNSQFPRIVLQSLVGGMKASAEGETMFPEPMYSEASGNVSKYAQREPMSLGTWVEQNKDLFE